MSRSFLTYRPIPDGTALGWMGEAACKGVDPDLMFLDGAEQHAAKRVCRPCPVRFECLAYALDNRVEWGVWGGKTERERRALLQRYPTLRWRSYWRQTGVIS